MQLNKRVEKLETRLSPPALRRSYLVALREGETQAEACLREGLPFDPDDDSVLIIFLKSISPRFDDAGDMIPFSDWPGNGDNTPK